MFNYVVECLVSNCSSAICMLFELFDGIREHLKLMKGRAAPVFLLVWCWLVFARQERQACDNNHILTILHPSFPLVLKSTKLQSSYVLASQTC